MQRPDYATSPDPGMESSRPEWVGEVRRVFAILAIVLGALGFGGLRAMDRFSQAADAGALLNETRSIHLMTGMIHDLMEAEAARGGMAAALGRNDLAGIASEIAEELEERHQRATALAWRLGVAGDVSATPAQSYANPTHQIDIQIVSLVRGMARLTELQGDRREAARAEVLHLASGPLTDGLARAAAVLELLELRLAAEARQSAYAAAGATAAASLMFVLLLLRGPRRRLGALRRQRDEALEELSQSRKRLRGAERDRMRMMDLAAAGLAEAGDRMSAAAGLLARTPMSETQSRVLDGLRNALGEYQVRIDGQRLLCAYGDGRLRAAGRVMRPGETFAAWAAEAVRLAEAEGRILILSDPPETGLELCGDEALLRRGLERLLEDALRRTAKGGCILLSARFEHLGRNGADLRIVLEHDGEPPGPTEIAAIRSPFTERPPSPASLPKGADPFCLAAVSAIASVCGGALEVNGDPKQGAHAMLRFRFTEPGSQEEPERAPAPLSPPEMAGAGYEASTAPEHGGVRRRHDGLRGRRGDERDEEETQAEEDDPPRHAAGL